jgi:arsenate reductase
MAEALLTKLAGDRFDVESAGLDPKPILPSVAAAMNEIGVDIGSKTSNSVFDYFKEGRLYDYVITVCDDTIEGNCPVFPGISKRLSWPFPDPEKVSGSEDEQAESVRTIRDKIKEKIENWIREFDQQ